MSIELFDVVVAHNLTDYRRQRAARFPLTGNSYAGLDHMQSLSETKLSIQATASGCEFFLTVGNFSARS